MAIRTISMLSWLAVGIFFSSLTAFSQPVNYSFEQIDSLQKTEPRNVLVFIHTDWCRFCLEMENSTFKNAQLTQLINEKFYFVSLNAEEKRTIQFNNHVFEYKPTGAATGVHELAEQLGTLNNKLKFPTICILNPDYEIIFQTAQFINDKNLMKILSVVS